MTPTTHISMLTDAQRVQTASFHMQMGFTRVVPLFMLQAGLAGVVAYVSFCFVRSPVSDWLLIVPMVPILLVAAWVALLSTVFVCFFAAHWLNRRERPIRVVGRDVPAAVAKGEASAASHDALDVVECVFSDRLGNRLFQYVYARVYANLHNLTFRAPEPLPAPFARAPQVVHPTQHKRGEGVGVHEASLVNEEAARNFRVVPASPWAQSFRLWAPYAEKVHAWMLESVEDGVVERGGWDAEDEVVLHVRCGDAMLGYVAGMGPLPAEFYEHVVRSLVGEGGATAPEGYGEVGAGFVVDLRRIVVRVVTEDASHAHSRGIAQRLAAMLDDILRSKELERSPLLPKQSRKRSATPSSSPSSKPGTGAVRPWVVLQQRSVQDDFTALRTARVLILSPSTFAVWAAFLGDRAQRRLIIYPVYGILEPELVAVPAQPWNRPSVRDLRLLPLVEDGHLRTKTVVREVPLPNLAPFYGPSFLSTNFDGSRDVSTVPRTDDPELVPWFFTSGLWPFAVVDWHMFLGPFLPVAKQQANDDNDDLSFALRDLRLEQAAPRSLPILTQT
jgi:hypothetical protein